MDDYSRMTWVTFLKEKYEEFEKFKAFKALVENKTDLKIKCLRSNRGGEFISNEFEEFFEFHGIKSHFSSARTSQQNGVVERKNRTIQDMDRTIFNEANLSNTFWRKASNTAVYIPNRAENQSQQKQNTL
jgi:transposase InsO family protein